MIKFTTAIILIFILGSCDYDDYSSPDYLNPVVDNIQMEARMYSIDKQTTQAIAQLRSILEPQSLGSLNEMDSIFSHAYSSIADLKNDLVTFTGGVRAKDGHPLGWDDKTKTRDFFIGENAPGNLLSEVLSSISRFMIKSEYENPILVVRADEHPVLKYESTLKGKSFLAWNFENLSMIEAKRKLSFYQLETAILKAQIVTSISISKSNKIASDSM